MARKTTRVQHTKNIVKEARASLISTPDTLGKRLTDIFRHTKDVKDYSVFKKPSKTVREFKDSEGTFRETDQRKKKDTGIIAE